MLLFVLLGLASAEIADFTNHAVVETSVPMAVAEEFVELLRAKGVDVWDVQPNPATNLTSLDLLLTPQQYEQLAEHSALKSWHVRVTDMEALVAEERTRLASLKEWNATDSLDDFFNDFRPTQAFDDLMDRLVRDNPTLASAITIGRTVSGREIRGVRLAVNGNPRPSIYIQGCVHAREWLACSSTMWFIYSMLEGYGTDDRITRVMNAVDFHIVPIINRDGYEFTRSNNRMWRKNRRANPGGSFGVDINRNWGPANTWCTSGSSRTPSADTYCGPSVFSEPETSSARDYSTQRVARICGAVDMHTYSNLILWPYQYTYNRIPEPDYSRMVRVGTAQQTAIRNVHGQTYRSQQGSALYPHSGGMIDFLYEEFGIPTATYEGRGTNFVVPPAWIRPAGEEQLAGIFAIADECIRA